jgi:L-threonylcarbamoyladenylate synthase
MLPVGTTLSSIFTGLRGSSSLSSMSQDKSRGVLESNSNQHQIVPVSVTIVLPKQVFHPTLTVTVCTLIGVLRSVPITSTVVVSVVKIIVLAIILLFQFLKIQVTLLLLVQLVALSLLKITTTTTASYSGIIAYHYYNTPTKRAACTKRIIPSFRSHQYYRLPTRSSFCPATTTTNNYFRSRRGRELPPLNHWWKHPTMAYHTSSSTAMGTQDSSATDVVPPLHEQHPHTKQQQPSSSSSVSEAPIIVARRVSASLDSLQKCGDRLRNGYLVSFPTETVYGLGCHALDPQAISKVYAAKERPFTDPLILHVSEISQALPLWDVTPTVQTMEDTNSSSSSCSTAAVVDENSTDEEVLNERWYILNLLCHKFWPGPLTIVAPANLRIVPPIVMANTSYVAVRYPSHPIAQCLIRLAGVPIAAPSANKFGHVSPTRPDHVLTDLGMEDVWVIDPTLKELEGIHGSITTTTTTTSTTSTITNEEEEAEENPTSPTSLARICHVGVESTVIKINFASRTIEILRHGAISQVDLEACLAGVQDADRIHTGTATTTTSTSVLPKSSTTYQVKDSTAQKFRSIPRHKHINDEDGTNDEFDDDDDALHEPQVAPGQAIRHYSPNVVSYMISPNRYNALSAAKDDTPQSLLLTKEEINQLSKSVIIDFGGRLKLLQSYCLDYQDLSADGNAQEGASHIFEVLRWSEKIDGAERIYFPLLELPSPIVQGVVETCDGSGLLFALTDKLNRAASGVVVDTFL